MTQTWKDELYYSLPLNMDKKDLEILENFISKVVVEKMISGLESTPPGYLDKHTLQMWIELKQEQLREEYL